MDMLLTAATDRPIFGLADGATDDDMSNKLTCTHCGAPLDRDGLCPRCEFNLALEVAVADSVPAPADSSLKKFGEYELLEELGHGGMGVVYKARQIKLNRTVALKMLLLGQFSSEQSVKRFEREAQAAAALHHPNIVSIYDVGQIDGQHYFTMEYVEGRSLASVLRDGPLPPRQAAEYCRAVADAIGAAHAAGILHRDLKPSNIVIDPLDQPQITDFGLAKRFTEGCGSASGIHDPGSSAQQPASSIQNPATDLTLTGQILGSPNYLAPELAAGKLAEVGPTSDLFSVGAILYECLTGRPPFVAATLQETLLRIRDTEPVAPRILNRSVPRDLETICLKCLEKEPKRRYQTAKELAEELGRFLRGEPVLARPIGPVGKTWRGCKRKPVVAALVAALFLALAVGLAGILSEWQRAIFGELTARQHQYVADMNLVKQVWDEGNLKGAHEILSAYMPKAGEPDLRGFEWRYLWSLCQDNALVTIPCEPGDHVWSLATSPNHAFVVACGEKSIRLLDPPTGRELGSFSYPNPETNDTRCLVALASQATNLLAVHRAEGVVGIWDLATKTLATSFKPFTNTSGPLAFKHPRPQRLGQPSLALSPDGRLLATGEPWGYGLTLTVWEISARRDSPKHLWSRQLDTPFNVLRFSPDGQTLVANGKSMKDGTIGAWDVRTGNQLQAFPKESIGYINDLVFSPDGSLLAAAGVQSTINIWDFTNRVVKFRLTGHRGHVNSVAFSLDGSRLISAGADGAIRVWDVSSQKLVGMFRDPADREVRSLALAPGGNVVLSAAADEVRIWPTEPRQAAVAFQTGQQWGDPVISPDGKWLVTHEPTVDLKDYSEAESVKVWDLASHRERFHLIPTNKEPLAPVFSPDGRCFVLGGEDRNRIVGVWETALWDKANAPMQASTYLTNDFEVGSICFSPDGTIMALAGLCFGPEEQSAATNRLTFREVGTWRKLNILEAAGAGATREASATSAAFSHNSRFLAVGYRDGWVRLWDIKHQRLLKELKEHGGDMYGVVVSLSNDDRWLASTALKDNGDVALVDVSDPERARAVLVTKANGGGSWSAIFSPDSRSLVTSGNDGLIKFWNLRTLKIALTLEHGQAPAVFINFSRDGSLLASQDGNGLLKLWLAASFGEITQKEMERK
jgi:serine/threonine protein kinase/WD40 repeat protein